MKGATISTANNSGGGQITDIANAGNYEFFIVDSLDLNGNIIFPQYGLIKNYDAAGQVQVIRIPTLIMAGEEDVVLEKHSILIKDNIKDAQLSILEGADHDAPLADPELFNATVLKFLKPIN